MNSIIQENRDRWNKLADAGVFHSLPFFDFTIEDAKEYVFRYGILKTVQNLNVLCLGGGGGQDSVAFGLLGATLTVLDLSDVQLARDREAAQHHGLHTKTVQGNMCDLSLFEDNSFDIVWQPYSLNYSPTVFPVFSEVARVLKDKGIYYVAFANPFVQLVSNESWNGIGYLLEGSYIDGEDISKYRKSWSVVQPSGEEVDVTSPHQYRHSLSTVLNALAQSGFFFLYLQEWIKADKNAKPGSWMHLTQAAPPWFDSFWQLRKSNKL
jgi:ubiquinone/menaquinone biosynthesis C-methylase UbiE